MKRINKSISIFLFIVMIVSLLAIPSVADFTGTNPHSTPPNPSGFCLPVDNSILEDQAVGGNISQFFVSHRGIDISHGGTIGIITGKPIRAVEDGTVVWIQDWNNSTTGDQSWGNAIQIQHPDGTRTRYAHMNANTDLNVGNTVSQGEIIGYVGSTGVVTGPHLHFEVEIFNERANPPSYQLVDPITYLSGASTFQPVPQTLTGDVNGDGYDDIIEMRANQGNRQLVTILGSSSGSVSDTRITTSTTNSFVEDDPVFVADVNGDGCSDIIVHYVSNGYRAFLIYKGSADGSFNNPVRFVTANLHNTRTYPCKFLIGDFNGDRKDDFLVHYKDTSSNRTNLLYKGNENGGFDAGIKTYSTKTYIDADPIFAADVNGDGRCDVIVNWTLNGKRQLLTYTGNANGSFSSPVNFASQNAQTSTYENKFFVGDFNGDGKDDFLVHWSSDSNNTRNLLLYRGNTSGSFEAGIQTYTGSTNISSDPILIGDVNGDNIDDVIVEWGNGSYRAFNVYTGTSTGSFASRVITTTTNLRDQDAFPSRLLVADVTHDARSDVIVIWRSGNGLENVIVYKGLSTKKFSSGIHTAINEGYYLY